MGQDTEDVLKTLLNLDDTQIGGLKGAGVI
jgi:hypothetical protein